MVYWICYLILLTLLDKTLAIEIKYLFGSKKEKLYNTGECMQLFVGKVSAERLWYHMPKLKSFIIVSLTSLDWNSDCEIWKQLNKAQSYILI